MARRVCIIGAGISGLRCAAVLLENSYDVTIIEARDRIGGRIMQKKMGSLEVDTGANWVHKGDDNPIIKLAKETDTPLHQWTENTLLVDSDGNLVNSDQANEALSRVWGVFEKAMEFSTTNSSNVDSSTSLYDFFTDECEKMSSSGNWNEYEKGLVLGMAEMWGAYVGDGVRRQSLKFFFLEDCIESDDYFIPSNYKKIMSKVSEIPLARAKLRLGTVMTSVEAGENEQGRVCVKTSKGTSEFYDEVVITTPLGWLKKNKETIKPLAPRISKAIDSISYGRLEKVLIEFPSAFWESPQTSTTSEVDNTISFAHWLTPSYSTTTNPQKWRLECVSFNALPHPYKRNILLFYTFGDCSTHITTSIRDLEGTAREEVLKDFFEPYYSRLPGYEEVKCQPVRWLATEWGNDEFAGYGSYCNFQVGMGDAAKDVEAIRSGMPEKGIYFAGKSFYLV
ncbi:FAD/NAD(P)-binding protein [Glarea lozoyensis ATCC 20868]|uniref:FAD/NAD(P)-binding protein n=1 Tax=Glarea lozoyensis (strain ATCC 20868 / MF5171) TaxID=1116229 RepID=S3E4Q2_GLAL2|nr:FAD/NAD(P)-binding protein [Glarea lozoyensis ATCC 20868]EPE33393.1 FAD/NAD(P)-binding protein [Glarea lozoyensis ATCC 20868]